MFTEKFKNLLDVTIKEVIPERQVTVFADDEDGEFTGTIFPMLKPDDFAELEMKGREGFARLIEWCNEKNFEHDLGENNLVDDDTPMGFYHETYYTANLHDGAEWTLVYDEEELRLIEVCVPEKSGLMLSSLLENDPWVMEEYLGSRLRAEDLIP